MVAFHVTWLEAFLETRARLVAFVRTEVIAVSRLLNNQKITKQNFPKNICKFAEFTLRHAVTRLQFQDCNAF
jgi:hypothetical protein